MEEFLITAVFSKLNRNSHLLEPGWFLRKSLA